MQRNVNDFKVGLFVLAGLFLALGGLVWIGSAHLLESQKTYVTFFPESVQDLVPGTDIRYLGVKVGRVSGVSLAPDDRHVRVLMGIRSNFKVDSSIAVQLQKNGLTGRSHLGLVRLPKEEQPKAPTLGFPVKHPVIPSQTQVGFQQLEKDLNRIAQKLEALDIRALLTAWTDTGRQARDLLSSGDLRESLQNVREATADARDSVASLRRSSKALAAQVDAIPPGTLSEIAAKVDRMAGSGEEAVGSLSSQARDSLVLLRGSVYELNQVLSNLNRLIASLREEPSEILSREREKEPFGRK
jgi:phospholipid/cholesterol/gamma-HCH transport system substrate-binding protein